MSNHISNRLPPTFNAPPFNASPTGGTAPSCCSQASGCCQQGTAAGQNGGDLTKVLQELSRLAQTDPNGVAQALRQNPEFAQMVGGGVPV